MESMNKMKWSVLGIICMMVVFISCDDEETDNFIDENDFFNEFDNTTFFDGNDLDDDENFSNAEFNEGFFDAFDMDDDGTIDENELTDSRANFRASTTQSFSDLDVNDDNALDMDEFETDFNSNNFFGTFDENADTEITEREFSDGVFDRFDDDDDGRLAQEEFDAVFPHFE